MKSAFIDAQAQQAQLTSELRQEEYTELMRKYRQLLNDKKSFEDDINITFKKQGN